MVEVSIPVITEVFFYPVGISWHWWFATRLKLQGLIVRHDECMGKWHLVLLAVEHNGDSSLSSLQKTTYLTSSDPNVFSSDL